MKKIDLSVIIPCYNAEKYINRSLDSIFKEPLQDFNIEVIVIDDGSTDSSLHYITTYKNKHNSITVIQQKNKGVSDAINAGLNIFKGEYVFVLAADDWCNIDSIFQALKIAKEKKLDLCAFGMDYFNDKMEHIGSKMRQPLTYNTVLSGREVLVNGYQPSSICVFLMHNTFFKRLKLRFLSDTTQNDVEISNRLMLNAERVLYTDLVGYNYFRHSKSITLNTNKRRREKYLIDSITVAVAIRDNLERYDLNDTKLITAITINYNSVVWNLLWRFLSKPQEVDYAFKLECINDLKYKNLYPIKGPLKTRLQRLTRFFMNMEFLLKWVLRR